MSRSTHRSSWRLPFPKAILLALWVLMDVPRCQAQAALLVLIFGEKAATENFHFSIDAGLNVASLPGLDGAGRQGFNFGLGTYIKINDDWAFTPEFKPLSPKGASDLEQVLPDPTGITNSANTEIRLNYIDMPLQVHRRISDRFYVRAGPQVSFLTKATLHTTGDLGTGELYTVEDDVKGDFERLDLSFPVDIGVVFAKPRGYKGVDLRLRYAPGFMEVFKDTQPYSSMNRVFQVFLSLPFVNVEPKAPAN